MHVIRKFICVYSVVTPLLRPRTTFRILKWDGAHRVSGVRRTPDNGDDLYGADTATAARFALRRAVQRTLAVST